MAIMRYTKSGPVFATLLCWLPSIAFAQFDQRVVTAPSMQFTLAPTAASRYFGEIQSIHGSAVVLRLRSNEFLNVDFTQATENHLAVVPYVGELLRVDGNAGKSGIYSAVAVFRLKSDKSKWGMDIPSWNASLTL